MNGEERYNKFVEDIDKWVKSVGIVEIRANEEVEELLQTNPSDLNRMTHDQLQIGAYNLICYAEYLQNVIAKQKIAVEWADESIWYVIADKLNNYGGKYAKWQEKYYNAIKENPLTSQLLKIKFNAESRIKTVEHSIETVKKLSDILLNLARRK